ncbi:helix-turn-helix domain-containing protein [Paenibacillus sp. Marseille-Q4541]|uniref:helix-turn-helix domain-containing protein n=1 Tax=Paenibacillus sp. Marseille-Q4541 TaxID=2831522 RepID=UPI001BA65598|nr:helix-turn-helix domain-containing protein [Paenibacillus sp. Marseille-Q4541]
MFSQEMLTIPEVMKHFKISDSSVRRLLKSGELKSIKVGMQRRIKPEWLKEYEVTQMKGEHQRG